MHFFYIDEAGCNLRDLRNQEAPIFVLGGVIVKDKGWNKTHSDFERIINAYFENSVPVDFELHSHELLSPNGDGHFQGHDREKRNNLAFELLELLQTRGHQVFYHAVDKKRLDKFDVKHIRNKGHVELKTPYLLCYDNGITTIEWFVKERLGSSARGMVILDEKFELKSEIEALTLHRRFHPSYARRVKWISEFSYPVDSKKNPMVQLSDLVCFTTKKFLGIDSGYHDEYSMDAREFYRKLYLIVDDRIVKKGFVLEEGRYADAFNDFMKDITPKLRRGWKTRPYVL